jgi:hypothetical protein
MKKRITENRTIKKNVYKDYHLLKIYNGPSIQFKKSGDDYIVRVVTAQNTVDKNELKKLGFGKQSDTKIASDYNFTKDINWSDVTLNKSQFEKLVSVVEKGYLAFGAAIRDFYSSGKILDHRSGVRRVNEDVSVKDGKYHFYSKDGLAYLKYNGKEIASGDFDFEGGNTYWLSHSSWKGQKAFDSGKEAIAYFKKNGIINESSISSGVLNKMKVKIDSLKSANLSQRDATGAISAIVKQNFKGANIVKLSKAEDTLMDYFNGSADWKWTSKKLNIISSPMFAANYDESVNEVTLRKGLKLRMYLNGNSYIVDYELVKPNYYNAIKGGKTNLFRVFRSTHPKIKVGSTEDFSTNDIKAQLKSDIMSVLTESVNEANINWKEFYTMAKDTSRYNPEFEKKYGKILDRPHVADALEKSKDFNSFVKFVNQFESVNEGIWPKSKLSDRFEFILSDELRKNFKGIFYVVGYDLYHNDKKVMTINSDRDSVNSIIKSLKVKLKESINESKYNKDLDKIEAAVKNAKSFMGVGAELKKAGIKYEFSTSMIPMYMIKVPGNTIAIVNKKYAAGAEREVGDTAIGLLETKFIKESKFKSGDNVTVKYPTLVKPIKGIVSNILKGPDGDIVVLKGNNGVWDEKYVSLTEGLNEDVSVKDGKYHFYSKDGLAYLKYNGKEIASGDFDFEGGNTYWLSHSSWKGQKAFDSGKEAIAYFKKNGIISEGLTKSNLRNTIKSIIREETEYQQFFKKALEKAGKSIPDMSDDEKKAFFNKIDTAWKGKGEKNEELVGNQHKLDIDGDGEIDASDLAALRAGKKKNEALYREGKTRNRSIKENATRTAAEIGGLTGMNKNFIQKFIDDNKLDIEKVFQYVKGGKTKDRMDFVTALSGKPGNTYQKKLIKMFGESVNEANKPGDRLTHKHNPNIEIELISPTNKGWKVYQIENGKKKIAHFDKQDITGNKSLFDSVNEDCGCGKVNEVSIDVVKRNALSDKNTSNWKLDTGIKKRMQTRSQFGNITTSNDVKFLISPKVKVIDLGKDDVYIFTDGERELIYRLPEKGIDAYNFFKLKALSKARPVVSNYYADKVKD